MEAIRDHVIELIEQKIYSDGCMIKPLNVDEEKVFRQAGMLLSPGVVFVAKAGMIAFKYKENLYLVQVGDNFTKYEGFALFL